MLRLRTAHTHARTHTRAYEHGYDSQNELFLGMQSRLTMLVLRWLEKYGKRLARGFYPAEGVGMGYGSLSFQLPPGARVGRTQA